MFLYKTVFCILNNLQLGNTNFYLFRAHSVAPTAQGVADEESMAGTKETKPRFISAIRAGPNKN
jgi:hypothetical protein